MVSLRHQAKEFKMLNDLLIFVVTQWLSRFSFAELDM